MVQFRWIKMSLFVILVLQFTAAVTGRNALSFTARVGDEVTFPCENMIKNQDKCDGTSWVASRHPAASTRELIHLGKISQNEISKANITEKCSLVIKNVTVDDAGRYSCRQFIKSGETQQGEDSEVHLSVINMEQHQINNNTATLFCSVRTFRACEHTVEWLYEGNENVLETLQPTCSATVAFKTPPLNQKSNFYESLKCNITDNKSGQMLLCTVGPPSSCERKGSTLEERNKTPTDATITKQDWLIIGAVLGLAALLIIVVAVIRWKRTKGNKIQMDENIGQSLNPAVTQPGPETSQDTADPEDDVAYASISHAKTTNSKAQVCGTDDEGDAVTYSTVKPSSSAAEASADPSNLYATVNKANK